MDRTCLWCAAAFTPTHHCQRLCSDECKKERERERDRGYGRARYVPKPPRPSARVIAMCQECGREFETYRSRAKVVRFCSWGCRAAQPRNYRPSERVAWACVQCGKADYRIASRANNKFCGMACRDAYTVEHGTRRKPKVALVCAGCGKTFHVPPSLSSRKNCSRACANLTRRLPGRVSKIQSAVAAELERRHPEWGIALEVRVARWAIDIAIPAALIAIEIDGIYWHSLPNVAEKDRRKDRALRAAGWHVMRVPIERETPHEVVALIEEQMAGLLLPAC